MIFALASCRSSEQPGQVDNSGNQEVQSVLDKLVETNEIPGINLSFIRADGRQFNVSSGFEQVDSQTQLTASHVMLSGSIGKTYVAAVIMQLVDEQQLRLDDPVVAHLPDYRWLSRVPNIERITLRMLLRHTSGLPRWVMKPAVWEVLHEQPDKVWSYEDRLAFVFDDDPVHEPGADWAYSDTNYLLLGMVIEAIQKEGYYDVLKSRILSPYQLKETIPSIRRDLPNLAMGYSKLPESFHIPEEVVASEDRYVFNPQVEWTGGGLASTTSDLAKWCKLYYAGELFSDSLRMKTREVSPVGKEVISDMHSYGMGTFVYNTKHGVAYGHSGFMPGYNSIFAYYPENELAVAVQVNCDYAARNMSLVDYLNEIVTVLL